MSELQSTVPAPRTLDLESPKLRADPYPVYRWFRENSPVHRLAPKRPGGVTRYLLTRWDDLEAGLKNPRLKRSIHPMALWNQPLDQVPPAFQTYARITRSWPLFCDPPKHAPLRRPVNRILEGSQEDSTALLREVLDETLRGLSHRSSFDAMEEFAHRVPLAFDLAILGIRGHTVTELGAHLHKIALALGNVFDPVRIETASHSMEFLTEWIRDAIARYRAEASPANAPFLTRLIALQDSGLIEGDDQVTATALLLLQAAQDTTSSLIGNGILTLLRHPHVLPWMLEREDRGLAVVEEVLRYESPVQQITRHASEPLEIRGVKIAPGEGVSFLLGAANRDPAVFKEPDLFNPARLQPGTASFAFGPHTCPGAHLARKTAAECWNALFARFPTLCLTSDTIQWRPTVTFRSPETLPVRIKVS